MDMCRDVSVSLVNWLSGYVVGMLSCFCWLVMQLSMSLVRLIGCKVLR